MLKVIRYIKGYLMIKIWGYAPERFINLCANHNIVLWDMMGYDGYYIVKLSLSDFWKIKSIARKTKIRVVLLQRYGLPFFIKNHEKRKMFLAGFPLCICFLLFMTRFIWSIEFSGNYQITDDMLMDFIENEGISYGTKLNDVQTEMLELKLRSIYPDITWTSVSIDGTKLLIAIKENDLLEEYAYENHSLEEYDLIASQDGIIDSILTRSGVPLVKKGDEVHAGDILISGSVPVHDNDGNIKGFHYVAADGDIYLRTEVNIKEETNRYYQYHDYSGEEKTKYFIEIGTNKFAFQLRKIPFLYYDIIEEKRQFKLLKNIYLPISTGKYIYRDYVNVDAIYSLDEGKKLTFDKFNQVMKTLEEKGVQILEKNVRMNVSDLTIGIYGSLSVITRQTSKGEIDIGEMEKRIVVPTDPENDMIE